jgi:hypothetical protein
VVELLERHGWGNCQPEGETPCWHHFYWDLNDWHSTEDAIERTKGKEDRLLACVDGKGPDWSGYADEYDDSRLSDAECEQRAAEGRQRQGF